MRWGFEMRVLDEREQVKEAITNWIANYGLEGTYGADRRGRLVGRELLALDKDTATAADVAEIIGNSSWATPRQCGECRVLTWGIVEIGEKPDYDSGTAYLCFNCLQSAIDLLYSHELGKTPRRST